MISSLYSPIRNNPPVFQNAFKADFGNISRTKASQSNETPAKTLNAEKILDKRVIHQLKNVFPNGRLSAATNQQYQSYSPENVANRIVSFIDKAQQQLSATQPDFDQDDFIEQAYEGIEQGFAEAKEILNGLGVLEGKIADDIEQTYQLTLNGLDRLQITHQNDAVSISHQTLEHQSQQNSQIEIKTQEGDLISIQFNQSSQVSQNVYTQNTASQSASYQEQSYQRESSLNVQIKGNLNEEEKQALDDLLNQMNQISDNFFQGKQKKAFQQALSLGFDSNQIASFSLDLNRQAVTAISNYQQYSSSGTEHSNTTSLNQANQLLNDARQQLDKFNHALDSYTAPKKTFENLFSEIADLFKPELEDKQLHQHLTSYLSQQFDL